MHYLFASKSIIRHALVGQLFAPEIEVGLTITEVVDTWDEDSGKVEFNSEEIQEPVYFAGSIDQIKALIGMLEDTVAEAERQMEMLRAMSIKQAESGGKDGG